MVKVKEVFMFTRFGIEASFYNIMDAIYASSFSQSRRQGGREQQSTSLLWQLRVDQECLCFCCLSNPRDRTTHPIADSIGRYTNLRMVG